MGRPRLLTVVVLAVGLASNVSAVHGQSARPLVGSVEGTLSTQGGTVLLPGVTVLVRRDDGKEWPAQVSDGEGHVRLADLPPDVYRMTASLDGFDSVERVFSIVAGQVAAVTIDMPIASVSERVDVVAASPDSALDTLATAETISNAQMQLLAPGGNVQASLRLLTAVIATPAGESIDGGRPDQAGFQIGDATLVDPSTNLAHVWLPTDGINSVAVLPNPPEAEFGRFSSGLVLVDTRRAADRWKVGVNNTVPAFRTKRYTVANIQGIGALNPSLEAGGPIVSHRLFLEQTAQYLWTSTDIPSRPEDELKTTRSYGSLTRVDGNLSTRHTLSFTGGLEHSGAPEATLGTFTPPASSASVSDNLGYAIVTERALVRRATFVESTLQLHQYSTDVHGQGDGPMELLPQTTMGDFFNHQHRESAAVQWVETASTAPNWPGGRHLVKVGTDVTTSDYDGTSLSQPVLVERTDGSVVRRLDFGAPTAEHVHSVDVAAFAQDRLAPSKRWSIEYGGRLDRDGLTREMNLSPRIGATVSLNGAATAVLRGGYGAFYERTPSIVGAFTTFEAATDSRFAADGITLLGPPTLVSHVVGDLKTAHSSTWDLAYDHQLNSRLALHVSVLERRGSSQLTLEPVQSADAEQLVLNSDGRSEYRQEEVGVHLTHGARLDLNASYVHSLARENLNAFVNFYGAVLTPIVGADQYTRAAADAPHRLLIRGRAMPTSRWMVLGTFDVRTGLPYSIVDEALQFVGPRNEQRFPTYVRTELGVDRRITLAHAHPWLGVRAANLFSAFLPTDVQANLASPEFGTFYNSEYRQIHVHIRFEH